MSDPLAGLSIRGLEIHLAMPLTDIPRTRCAPAR